MRTNAMTIIESQFKGYTKDQLVNCAINFLSKIFIEMQNLDNDTEKITSYFAGMIVLGAKLGVGGDEKMNDQEKKIIDDVYTHFFQSSCEVPQEFYDEICCQITEDDYKLVEKICSDLDEDTVMHYLFYILSIAYIDGRFEDEVADRLDEIFSFKMGIWYLKNGFGGANVKVTSASSNLNRTIKLSGLEAEVYQWFKNDDQFHPLKDIQSHFSRKTKSEIQSALDSLCAKGVLMGGERIVGNSYCLTNEVEVEICDNKEHSCQKRIDKEEKRKKAEEEKRKQEEKRKKEEEEKRKEAERVRQLEKSARDAEAHFNKLCDDLDKLNKAYKSDLEAIGLEMMKEYKKQQTLLQKAYNVEKEKLSQISFFKFKEKKDTKSKIKDLKRRLKKMDNVDTVNNLQREINESIKRLCVDFANRLNSRKKEQFPNLAIKFDENGNISNEKRIEIEIYRSIGTCKRTVSEIIENSEYLQKYETNSSVNKVLRRLKDYCLVLREEIDGIGYFSSIDGTSYAENFDREQEQRRNEYLIEKYKENSKVASLSYPNPDKSVQQFETMIKHKIAELL